MRDWGIILCVLLLAASLAAAQSSPLGFPEHVEAGIAFSVSTSGSGSATLYIVGPASTLRREVQLGNTINFSAEELHSTGHYVAFLTTASSSQAAQFDVVASRQPAKLSFLAKPSRLPVNLTNGISGVAYVFDAFGNLILQPQEVSFELTEPSGHAQVHTVTSRNGVAWVKMNSAAKAGTVTFRVRTANVEETRVVQQVPGDPCSIRMTARAAPGQRVVLETEPVRDCSGNPVPDGTIVSFSETYAGSQSTVDVPLKRGVARTELPARPGAVISVASGIVMGNEIRWNGGL